MFEIWAGRDIRVSLRFYQILSAKRKEKATEKLLQIMRPSDAKSVHGFARGNSSKEQEAIEKNMTQALKNKELLQETKKPPRNIARA